MVVGGIVVLHECSGFVCCYCCCCVAVISRLKIVYTFSHSHQHIVRYYALSSACVCVTLIGWYVCIDVCAALQGKNVHRHYHRAPLLVVVDRR